MGSEIIGRKEELLILKKMFESQQPEFLAIYGRRRVGKTFLIRTFFESKMEECIFFNVTGAKKGKLSEQIRRFTKQIGETFYNGAQLKAGKNWDEAFEILTDAMKNSKSRKIILFFDELPWMATKNSRLLQNLDYYWNQYWSRDNRIKLIICGSSASWIIDKVVNNKGGLHNRLTRNIYLEPFNLFETKNYLNHCGVKLSNKQIVQIYMTIGGVPYYLSKIEKGLSATQNIETLSFRKKAFLLEEFDNLFSSLFNDHENYSKIITIIAKHRQGIGQEELFKKIDKSLRGKKGIRILKALRDAGFIINFKPLFHEKKGIYYKVIDEYTLFYIQWIDPIRNTLLEKGLVKGYWEKLQNTPEWYSWAGSAFESICYQHIAQISQTLNLSPTSIPNTWRYVPKKGLQENGAQIDLLFDRDDDSITLCEIKYTEEPFSIDKRYFEILKNKEAVFRQRTKTKKHIFWAFISGSGLKKSIYSEEIVDGLVTLEDLFIES